MSGQDGAGGSGRPSVSASTVVWAAAAVVLAVIGATTFLTMTHFSATPIIGALSSILAITIPMVNTMVKVDRNTKKIEEQRPMIEAVQNHLEDSSDR